MKTATVFGQAGTAAVLGKVDAAAFLGYVRPVIFEKGVGYAFPELPGAVLLEAWDGRGVTLPCVEGRFAARPVRKAASRGAIEALT